MSDNTMPASRRTRRSMGAQSPAGKAVDKENVTVDVASTLAANRKKSRSKSMGPGSLDALKPGSGNRRASLAAPSRPPPRSILKPTAPIVPEIPPHKKKENGTTAGAKKGSSPTNESGSASSSSTVALRTEEEQQAAAREREERERREARRKSLANRRVSFAAEATLHTFHEIEYMQDSTTSTDSTRRRSSMAAPSSALDLPSTPQEQIEEPPLDIADNQRELHQKKRRRSSAMSFVTDDDTINSTFSDDSEPADAVEEVQDEEAESSDSDSDSDDGTMMTVEAEEITGASVMSARSTSSGEDTLDEILRVAARRAGTQQLDDDHDNETGEEVIAGFAGWGKKTTMGTQGVSTPEDEEDEGVTMEMDMEMTNAVGGILKPASPKQDDLGEDMSMDVTRALGGILPSRAAASQKPPAAEASPDDTTMDLTVAIGNIRKQTVDEGNDVDENEDMSMELTSVVGGVFVIGKGSKTAQGRRRTVSARTEDVQDGAPMDMTMPVGRILGPQPTQNDVDGDVTMGMEMTTALGTIIQGGIQSRLAAKKAMEAEVDRPDDLEKPISTSANSPFKKKASPKPESPGLSAFRGKGLRRSAGPQVTTTPITVKKPKTPSPAKASTPSATLESTTEQLDTPTRPPQTNSTVRQSKSPKRTSLPNQRPRTPSPAKSPTKGSVFRHDPTTGATGPSVVLTPQNRRLSGIGADKSGLGSPRVTAIMDRRGSIGESADMFIPGQTRGGRAVTFGDPKVIEDEIDQDRQDEEDKENSRKILEREADDQENTLSLRDMIDSMSPKKNFKPLMGRKSLHVGSAMGLLGKRPAELDDDEELEENDGVKRLKGHQGSPVKNVRLQQPPSKAETTGRLTRSARRSMEQTAANTVTPTTVQSPARATTPKSHGRFRDVRDDTIDRSVNFVEPTVREEVELEAEDPDDRIHLQDFLNMTSIRFMELNTTKRRHTQAPDAFKDGFHDDTDDASLERRVVAGACTVPLLELYQHSCRECKKYISEGRRIVQEIEADTYEDNPPLFREYMAATPDIKTLMDNQFKHVKTNARLLSKAGWYEWRTRLQEGLKEGLVKIGEGMSDDDKLLAQQEGLLESVLPALAARYEALEQEHADLELAAQELAECDPDELQAARADLGEAENEAEHKVKLLEELRQQLKETEAEIDSLKSQKQACLDDIKSAEKVREDCRGWATEEVSALKGRVDALEQKHGWAITGAQGTQLSMTYKREIELVFDAASFQPDSKQNSRIDLWYIAANREHSPLPATVEREFVVQCIRDHVRALPQSRTRVPDLLAMVRTTWDLGTRLSNDIRLANTTFPTKVTKTGDNSIEMRSVLLIKPAQTKVEVVVGLRGGRARDGGVALGITPSAVVAYGHQFNVAKVGEYLATRLGGHVGELEESWSDVLVELHERLVARGRRAAQQ